MHSEISQNLNLIQNLWITSSMAEKNLVGEHYPTQMIDMRAVLLIIDSSGRQIGIIKRIFTSELDYSKQVGYATVVTEDTMKDFGNGKHK